MVLAFTFDAVSVAVLLQRQLGPVPDQETRVAGELVLGLRDDLYDEFLGDEFPARHDCIVKSISFIQLTGNAAGVRSVGRLQCLQGMLLGLLNVGSDFVVIGSHCGESHS